MILKCLRPAIIINYISECIRKFETFSKRAIISIFKNKGTRNQYKLYYERKFKFSFISSSFYMSSVWKYKEIKSFLTQEWDVIKFLQTQEIAVKQTNTKVIPQSHKFLKLFHGKLIFLCLQAIASPHEFSLEKRLCVGTFDVKKLESHF